MQILQFNSLRFSRTIIGIPLVAKLAGFSFVSFPNKQLVLANFIIVFSVSLVEWH